MKNILLIGLGRFGYHVAKELSSLKTEVLAVDNHRVESGLILYSHCLSSLCVLGNLNYVDAPRCRAGAAGLFYLEQHLVHAATGRRHGEHVVLLLDGTL